LCRSQNRERIRMNDFEYGLLIGSSIIGAITIPLVTYFGLIYFNLRNLEKSIIDANKDEYTFVPDDETAQALKDAEEILATVGKK